MTHMNVGNADRRRERRLPGDQRSKAVGRVQPAGCNGGLHPPYKSNNEDAP
jgi:hypothetical protein